MAQRYCHTRNAMYIGRGINFPVALEGALKLKEVSDIHAEGYAAGELKHGPIALLDPDVPVVALARARTLPKMVSNIQEVSSRDAPVIAVVTEGENPFDAGFVRDLVEVPLTDELISPLVNVVPLQLFAYHVAVERGWMSTSHATSPSRSPWSERRRRIKTGTPPTAAGQRSIAVLRCPIGAFPP